MIQLVLMTIGWLGSLGLIIYGTKTGLLREVNPIASVTLEYPIVAVAIALFCLSVCWIGHFKVKKKPKYLLITQWIVGVILFLNFIREIVLVLIS